MTGRQEFFMKMGIIKEGVDIDGVTEEMFRDQEEAEWKAQVEDHDRVHGWHTSFHASSFPGMEKSCGRQAMYSLMNIPEPEATEPWLRALMDVGKAIENTLTEVWGKAGVLLTGSVPIQGWTYPTQTHLELPDLWLGGSPDAVLDLRKKNGFPYALPVDVKGKDHDIIRRLTKPEGHFDYLAPDAEYINQVNAYTGLVHTLFDELGYGDLGLLPPVGGKIYFLSRQRPRTTAEIWVPFDRAAWDRGCDTLREWQELWKSGTLPPRDTTWRWTEAPCDWCAHKRNCKADHKAGVTKLADSSVIELAKSVNPSYDLDAVRKAVADRWGFTYPGDKKEAT